MSADEKVQGRLRIAGWIAVGVAAWLSGRLRFYLEPSVELWEYELRIVRESPAGTVVLFRVVITPAHGC